MGSNPAKTTGTSTNEISPELKPLFGQTAANVGQLQNDIFQQFGLWDAPGFFDPHVQQIPGFTDTQNAMAQTQINRMNDAFKNPYSTAESNALTGIEQMTGGPLGQSPATLAAMNAVRTPVLNDLALSGMGNSDAIASNLAGAFSPILAQEMAARQSLLPVQAQIGNIGYNRQTSNINDVMGTQEKIRGISETQGQAELQDFLRRQGLGTQFTTGILGGFPAVGGTVSSSKQSGGGK